MSQRRCCARVAAILFLTACVGVAQDAGADVFEVAAIKVVPPPTPGGLTTTGFVGGPGTTDPGQIRYLNMTLAGLIEWAYKGGDVRRIVGADSLDQTPFEITAKLPPATTKGQLRNMLRNLLAARFGVVVHREQREMSVYALVAGKDGPSLKPSLETDAPLVRAEVASAPTKAALQPAPVDKDGYPLPPGPTVRLGTITVRDKVRLVDRDASLGEFAETLSNYVRDIVVDKTGIAGRYNCSVVWAKTDGPTVFDSVKQLGLKLQPEKLPIGVIVVDHANKMPTEN